jgi:hypothetical protein
MDSARVEATIASTRDAMCFINRSAVILDRTIDGQNYVTSSTAD